jgi:hypothetical protein
MQEGWRLVFEAVGDTFTLWDADTKPAFDAFDESDPDIFILAGEMDKATQKCVDERSPRLKIVDGQRILPGLDTFNYYPGTFRPELECDVVYVGAYRPEKQNLLDKSVLLLCDEFKVKIVGDTPWPVPQYLGAASVATVRDLYASAKFSLCVETDQHPSERFFQIVGCKGCLCLSSDIQLLNRCLNDYPQFIKSTSHYILKDREAHLNHNTYWHRVAKMMKAAGLPAHSKKILETYADVSKGL